MAKNEPPAHAIDNPARLAALDALAILDTPPEQGFDDIVRLATRLCATSVALVSLVEADRQWFKARVGFPRCETDLNSSVCAHALSEPDLLIIPDLTADPRTAENPLVTGEPFIRFYAGAPLRMADGQVLGSLCIIDTVPRPGGLTAEQADDLRALGRQVVTLMEARQTLEAQKAEAKRASERQAILLKIGDRLRDLDTVPAIVHAAAELLAQALDATRSGYGLVDAALETCNVPKDWCAPGVASVAGKHDFRTYGSFIENLKHGQVVTVDDVTLDPRTRDNADTLLAIGVRVLLNVPVVERGRLVGIGFVHFDHSRSFTQDDLTFVRTVADRVQIAVARVQAEEHQALLNHELSHRLKNTLSMVQGIASQTLRRIEDQEPVEAFTRRVIALSRAHEVLLRESWTAAPIRTVVEEVLALHSPLERFRIDGPALQLGPQSTLSLSMLLHELATNAVKYGALSTVTGQVDLTWRIEADAERTLILTWRERGGPPAETPKHRGFGSRIILLGLVGSRDATLSYSSLGLDAEFRAPISQIQAS